MRGIVAVEAGLSPVEEALTKGGYRVVRLDHAGAQNVDAVIVRGTDTNVAGWQTI